MEVVEHKHPLKLGDLQIEYPQDEEEEEEEDDDDEITKEGFHGVKCCRCQEEIHMYHRHYYKCMTDSSCHFSLHKFCAELLTRLDHPSHPHPLTLVKDEGEQWQLTQGYWECSICEIYYRSQETHYKCSLCSFYIDLNCAMEVGKKIIDHPCHPHLLMCAISKPILCESNACGKRHEGIFYQCISTTCGGFTIHNDCAFLPKTLLIQQRTDGAFYLIHPLTISFFFLWMDQRAKHSPRCRVCGHGFHDAENLWICKCDDCLYYAHVDCATSRREPFMSIFLPPGKNIKNFEDADHPHILHLPFPDETYSIPKHLFFQGTITSDHKVNLKHMSHEHPLILVDIYVHPECALLLPKEIWHKHDKHPMHLPIENHKSEYFCEICEEDLNPHESFYHCQDCVQSVHTACAPLILQCETETYSRYHRGIHYFINIKFGGIYNSHHHPHPLSFAQGIISDGACSKSGVGLQCNMIFKCVKCKFAIDYIWAWFLSQKIGV